MQEMDRDTKMRVFIMDSLIARSGQVLSPNLISEITTEILERMIEIHEVALYSSEVLEHE